MVRTEMVRNCSACGKMHEVEFRKLFSPMTIRSCAYDYIGYCTEAEEYVYMKEWNCGVGHKATHVRIVGAMLGCDLMMESAPERDAPQPHRRS